MKKNYVMISLVIMIVLFVGGLVMLFNSTNLGQEAGHQAIQANGGSMDTQRYYDIMNSTAENYRTGGMVISLIGGFGVLLGGLGLYKEI